MTPIPHHALSSLPAAVLDAYPRPYFIETGTNTGKGVDVALARWPPYTGIWSCEADHALWCTTAPRFFASSHVEIAHNDSPRFLRQVLANLTAPAIIYLDAHTEADNPLLEELAAIALAPRRDHVILIDDVRMFGRADMPGWAPVTLNRVQQWLTLIHPAYTLRYADTVNAPRDLLIAATIHPAGVPWAS